MSAHERGLVRRFLTEDSAQDLVEYALLAALVGITGLLIWQQIAAQVGVAYTQADTDVQGVYCMPNPDGTLSPPCS